MLQWNHYSFAKTNPAATKLFLLSQKLSCLFHAHNIPMRLCPWKGTMTTTLCSSAEGRQPLVLTVVSLLIKWI